MNKDLENLIEIISDLADDGKDPKITVLPTQIHRKRKMHLRGRKTTG